jgi:deoxyribonuclease V
MRWPETPRELAAEQDRLAAEVWTGWRPLGRYAVGAVFVCFEQGAPGNGSLGDRGFAAAACEDDVAVVTGQAPAAYAAGQLALREGSLLERAARGLATSPDVMLVDSSGRDHPRRCGLALHLGAVLDVPTVGVTHRPLHAEGEWPGDERGATSPLVLDGERVGYWVRTKRGARPLAAHAAWRTGPEIAVEVLLSATERARSAEPLRRARAAARRLRGQQVLPTA